jgi:hypothetical protein
VLAFDFVGEADGRFIVWSVKCLNALDVRFVTQYVEPIIGHRASPDENRRRKTLF